MTDQEILTKAIEKAREFYAVTEDGRVFSKRRGNRELKTSIDHKGYPYVSIYVGEGKSKKLKVHRLVAMNYLPNPENLPHINHKNGNREDNRVENLEWCTAAYNVQDGFTRGRIVWNKDNASKERIIFLCKKYPRQTFWLLTKNDFQFAKALWGEDWPNLYLTDEYRKTLVSYWKFHLQQMVIADDPIKYLEAYL